MAMKGKIWEQIESYRVHNDLYKTVTVTSEKMVDILLPESAEGFFGISRDELRAAITQELINSCIAPALSVYSATFATNGVPSYFLLRLTQEQIDEMGTGSALERFGEPLDTY